MSYALVSIFVALQVLYFVVAVGQIALVLSKSHKNVFGKLKLRRTSSGSVSGIVIDVDSVQEKFIAFSSSALLLCCVLAAMRALLFILSHTRLISCGLMSHFGASIYQLFKTLMYLVFIFRADAVYRDTPYAYNTQLLVVSAVCVVLLNVVIIALYNVFVSGFEKQDAGALCVCGAKAPMVVLFPTIFQDIVLNIWLLHLFTRPLQLLRRSELPQKCERSAETSKPSSANESMLSVEQLKAHSVEQRSQGEDDRSYLQRVAVKCAVVTWVAVVSTLINLILVGTMDLMEFIVLDLLINNTCMIFMTRWCDQYFPKLCCVPLSMARIMPCLCGKIPEFSSDANRG